MMGRAWLTAVVLLLMLQQPGPWQPPVGVPMPDFGITEEPGAATLYVDSARGTDANPGTKAAPKRTVPLLLPRCTVVQVVGAYTHDHQSPRTIEAQGTAECPVWILADEWLPTAEFSGTYLQLRRKRYGFTVIRATRSNTDTHHIALRGLADGTRAEAVGGGIGVQATYSDAGEVHHVVVRDQNFHDLGTLNDPDDHDVMAFGIYKERNHHIWFLDSNCDRISSDCAQVNAHGDPAGIHHVYFGRITSDTNRQGGLWAKQATDVVFSENVARNMRPGSGGPGHGFGAQYGCVRCVFVKNVVMDSENGFRMASDDGQGPYGALIAWNLVMRIHRTTPPASSPGWSNGAAFQLTGGGPVTLLNNTIVDVDVLVTDVYGGPDVLLVNNVWGKVGTTFALDDPSRLRALQTNWADVVPTGLTVPQWMATKGLVGPLQFRSGTDLRLALGAPGIGAGTVVALDAAYEAIHGVPLGLSSANVGAELVLPAATVPDPPPAPKPCNRVLLIFGIRYPAGCQ